MDVRQLGTMALIVVVASIIIGIGSSILGNLATNQCSTESGTWVTFGYCAPGVTTCNSTVTNPVTSALYGCCSTALNGTQDCPTWLTSSNAINTSFKGMTGLTTMATWIPLIALVIVASIVIGVITRYMGGMGGV